jgi:hypothetical protein
MPNYVQFDTEGGTVLVEVEEDEVARRGGVSKAGLVDWIKENIAKADSKLDDAVQNAVKDNVSPFVRTAQVLSKETEAVEMEVTFGLVVTGELGNIAVGKAGAQSNYTVTLRWSQIGDSQRQDGSGS